MLFSLDPADRTCVEATIKNSRFIARLRCAESEDAASELIAYARGVDRGAGHHCFAYVIGDEDDARIERYSDDGEPAGTAGAPILNALKGRGVVNVAAVVSRYFGGVKLGAGGLARAYGGIVLSALEEANLRPRRRWQVLRLAADHAEAGWVESELRRRGFEVADVAYGNRAIITLLSLDADDLIASINEITAGRGEYSFSDPIWR